ncbi:MAG: recombinase RecA [Planctomycetota bacterium]
MSAKKSRISKEDRDTVAGLRQEEGENRNAALQRAIDQIEGQFGKGSLQRLDGNAVQAVAVIPTGALTLDMAIGVGGMPRGRVVEIFGPESSGKTTLALHVAANAQKLGGTAALIDAEHAFDPLYARKLGVNLSQFLINQPDTGEQALDIVDTLVKSGAVDVIIVDSVAALVPRAELEGEMGQTTVGMQARLMSSALRRLTASISSSNTVVIFINQLREKIGVMYGSPETTPGGRALKFYASVPLDSRRIGAIKNGEENLGNMVRVRVVKNKVAPPFRTAEFELLFSQGISNEGCLIDLGLTLKLIKKSGSWYSYGETRIGQGREAARVFLKENPTIAAELAEAVRANGRELMGVDGPAPAASETEGEGSPAGAAAGDDA